MQHQPQRQSQSVLGVMVPREPENASLLHINPYLGGIDFLIDFFNSINLNLAYDPSNITFGSDRIHIYVDADNPPQPFEQPKGNFEVYDYGDTSTYVINLGKQGYNDLLKYLVQINYPIMDLNDRNITPLINL